MLTDGVQGGVPADFDDQFVVDVPDDAAVGQRLHGVAQDVPADCLPLVAMHWEHRFNHMVGRYNEIYRVQMPNITPHVCRHTYCSNRAKAGMNPKTLQYLMGHSDIGVTLNTYTQPGLEDAAEELHRMEEAEAARREQEKIAGKTPPSQKMFRAVRKQH